MFLYRNVLSIVPWRKLQQHDLVPQYNAENSAVRKYFQMIGAIAFVEYLGDVLDTWTQLKV